VKFRTGMLVLLAAIVLSLTAVRLAWNGYPLTAGVLIGIALGFSVGTWIAVLKGRDW
jgi:hypothetical protein